jgi:hypothetical protein
MPCLWDAVSASSLRCPGLFDTCAKRKSRGADLAYLTAPPPDQARARRMLHDAVDSEIALRRDVGASRREGRQARRGWKSDRVRGSPIAFPHAPTPAIGGPPSVAWQHGALDDGPRRREAARRHSRSLAKCSRARTIAGLSGFFTLSQSRDGPDR